ARRSPMKLKLKLAAGFASILVLSALVGGIGYKGMDSMSDRVAKEASTSALLTDIYEIRQQQVNYRIQPNETQLTQTKQLLTATKTDAEQLRTTFLVPEHQQSIQHFLTSLNGYSEAFETYSNATQQQQQLAETMRVAGRDLQTLVGSFAEEQQRQLEELDNAKVSAQLVWDEAREASQANRLAKDLVEARIEERNYVLYAEERHYQSLLA